MNERQGLDGWLEVLESRHAQTIQLGLERVADVFGRLAPRGAVPVVITVGGTNGKGSSCAMLESIYRAASYRVGVYTSPHLVRYTERVRIAGEEASEAAMVAALERVEAAREDVTLTYFEHGTLAAWWLFCEAHVDVVILEVGLGGRLDAVNVIDPDCALLTGVALDHQDYLGATLETIGFEKAGIFRPGRPAICADPQPPASVLEHATAIGADFHLAGRDFGFSSDHVQWQYWLEHEGASVRRSGLGHPALRGVNQLRNAAAVLTVVETLKPQLPVSMQAVREGLMHVSLAGRFQIIPGQPPVVLDVAHNVEAAAALAENLFAMGFFAQTVAVLGMYADKDVEGVVRRLAPRVDRWLLCDLDGPRGLSAEALVERVRGAGVEGELERHRDPVIAFSAAQRYTGENDRILVFGSFMTVAAVMQNLEVAGTGRSRGRN